MNRFATHSPFGMLRNMSPSVVSLLRRAVPAALFSSTLLTGCAYGEMPQVLRAQVATESKCSEVVVRQAPSYTPGYSPNQYLVKGCGIDRVYTCNGDKGGLVKFGSADCSFVAAGAPAQAAPGAAPSPGPSPEPDAEPGLDEPDDQNG
jgi:hypothetical protein